MTIFRENTGNRDRSAEDRRRHRELVQDAIKKNVGNIVADESIIGVSKDKKIKVPIKSKKEYQFLYGKNQKGVSSGNGNEKRGDKLGEEAAKGAGQGQGPGNQEGEDIYETEITIEELINHLFDNMQLPDLDRRKLSEIDSFTFRKLGFQLKGIPPRLAKKKSMVERIKRKQGEKRFILSAENDIETEVSLEETEKRFPFREEDLRYNRIRTQVEKIYNAVVFCIMDVSGSMNQTKKYLARSFYFLLYQFLKLKYENVEVVFIAHTTTAKEVSEREFFHKGESGGTYISSGYEKALEIIESRYNPNNWNIYAFHCSDGDNWQNDNQKAANFANQLCDVCNMVGYVEIPVEYEYMYYSPATSVLKLAMKQFVKKDNFYIVDIFKIEDVYPGLKKLLLKEGDSNHVV